MVDKRRSRSSSRTEIDRLKNTDKVEKPVSKFRVERDSNTRSNSGKTRSEQVINNLAALSINPEGRKEIQQIIDRQPSGGQQCDLGKTNVETNEEFYEKCISVLKRKGLSVPLDLQAILDRHMEVNQVREKWGAEFANVFAYVRGWIVEEKAKQLVPNNETIHQKFKPYHTNAKWQKDYQFYVKSSLSPENTCEVIVDLAEESINVLSSKRKKASDALQLSDHLGEIWQYLLSKIRKDEFKNTINMDISKVDECLLKKLTRSNITNIETKNTVILLLKEELQALLRKRPLKEGSVEIARGSNREMEKLVGIIGTPNGYAAAFLPRCYDFIFGYEKVTKIEAKFNNLPRDVAIDKIKHSDIHIDEINFYFD
jgi:hypothetical protein